MVLAIAQILYMFTYSAALRREAESRHIRIGTRSILKDIIDLTPESPPCWYLFTIWYDVGKKTGPRPATIPPDRRTRHYLTG